MISEAENATVSEAHAVVLGWREAVVRRPQQLKELDRNEREKEKELKGERGRKTGKKRKEYDRAIERERKRKREGRVQRKLTLTQ